MIDTWHRHLFKKTKVISFFMDGDETEPTDPGDVRSASLAFLVRLAIEHVKEEWKATDDEIAAALSRWEGIEMIDLPIYADLAMAAALTGSIPIEKEEES